MLGGGWNRGWQQNEELGMEVAGMNGMLEEGPQVNLRPSEGQIGPLICIPS